MVSRIVRTSVLESSNTDRGIMDRAHLPFFTRRSALRMVRQAGFEPLRREMTVMPLEVAIGSPDRNPLIRLAHWLLILCTWLTPGLFGYQTFVICRATSKES